MAGTPEWAVEKIREAKEKRLAELDLSGIWSSGEKLAQIPDEVFELEHLEELRLWNNQLTAVPAAIGQLRNLAVLNLADNLIAVIPEAIGQLRNLAALDLQRNQIAMLPDALLHLECLHTLYLGHNRLTDLPGWFAELRSLTTLWLGGNRFAAIPTVLAAMPSLKELDFAFNPIKVIPEEIAALPCLRFLGLVGNPIEEPPPEVVGTKDLDRATLAKIRDYYRQRREAGTDCLYEAKLLIVGEAGAGKTSLARKLQDPAYQLRGDEESTQGIGVLPWQFALDDGRPFRVNVWDFGGQEVYHATHQFFLTKRSLYLLVADTRKEDTDFYYWLNVADLLSDHSPLLVVKNEKQDRHREINERQLGAEFSNLQGALAANLADNRGLPELVDEVKRQVRRLPHVGTALPRTWVRVRERLEKDPRPYIGVEEYLAICEENGFARTEDKLQLSGYLHDLGVCLHFQDDPILRHTVILKPEWGTAAVYKALDNPAVIRNLGQFSRKDLARIWSEPQYEGMHDELLQLMIKFQLCYPLPGSSGEYIAPQLLTENQPEYGWDEADNLLLRYRYEFMPKGILTRLIVAMHPLIEDQRLVWRSGAILAREGARAEVVEHYGRREVRVRVSGREKKGLMAIASYELERIHAAFHRLRYNALIPCRCDRCRSGQEPFFYRLEVLQRFLAESRPAIQCQESGEMVEVWPMVNDVPSPALGQAAGRGPGGAEGRAGRTNLCEVRHLLMAAYKTDELRELFILSDNPELRPLRDEVSEAAGLEKSAVRVIEYCEHRGLLGELLREVERDRPAVFAWFAGKVKR